jgi:hypothetical protein
MNPVHLLCPEELSLRGPGHHGCAARGPWLPALQQHRLPPLPLLLLLLLLLLL